MQRLSFLLIARCATAAEMENQRHNQCLSPARLTSCKDETPSTSLILARTASRLICVGTPCSKIKEADFTRKEL